MATQSKVETFPQPIAQRERLPFIEWLIRAHPSITSQADIRRSRLLASLLAVIVGAGAVLITYYFIDAKGDYDADLIAAMVAWVIGIGLYFVNRAGKTNIAAVAIIALFAALFSFAPFVPNAQQSLVFYTMLPVLLTATFFRPRSAAIVAGVIAVLVSLMMVITGDTGGGMLIDGMLFTLFATAILITYANHNRVLEAIRRAELVEANEKLRESEALLEQRVKERTRDLQVAAEVSQQMTTVLDLESLLPVVAETTRAAFGLYGVSVFLYDEAHEQITLAAGTGEAGEKMLAQQFGFALDQRPSVVARAARESAAVVVNDLAQAPDFLPNPLQPETRSELVLPMMVGSNLIGVLDFQADVANRFSQEDVEIMTTLAEQVAIAVRNAQLFTEAEEARQAAELANQVKSRFLANMSHELRTPLNAILNFSAFVGDGVLGPVNDDQKEALDQSISSGKHLLSLINDVLDITKIEAGMMELFIQEVDFNEIVASAVSVARGLLKDKPDVKLFTEIGDDLPSTYGDKRRLRQVLLNLMSNAVKFTHRGEIRLTAEYRDGNVFIAVKDTGIGIAPEDHALVFDSFKQAKHDLSGVIGTGLGMPISRYFVESHQGEINFVSEPGEGTTFFLRLPVLTETEADLMSKLEAPAA